jgi:hypothetical protein
VLGRDAFVLAQLEHLFDRSNFFCHDVRSQRRSARCFICLIAKEDIREAILEFHIFHDEIITGT